MTNQHGVKKMRFDERIIETFDRADFFFDIKEKMITKEYNPDYIPLSVKGEYATPNYIGHVLMFLESANDRRAFDKCKSFDDLKSIEI